MVFTVEQRLKIKEVKSLLNRVSDRAVIDALVSRIYDLEDKLERKKAAEWGNEEYVRDLEEQNRAYENKLGYY